MLPYNDNPNAIINIDSNSNVNYRGRFIFRVDEWIQPAGCKNEFYNGSYFIKLEVFLFKLKNTIKI